MKPTRFVFLLAFSFLVFTASLSGVAENELIGARYPAISPDGTVVAFLGLDEWRIHLPVKHGDTIHMVVTTTEKRLTSKGDRGIVTFKREIFNQRDEVVQSMETTSMYLCRPQA